MCLAIPGKLIEKQTDGSVSMGRIDYSGTIQTACLEYLPEVEVGQYVLVHAGFAISIVQEDEAKRSLELLAEIAEAHAKDGLDPFGTPLEEKKQPTESENDK